MRRTARLPLPLLLIALALAGCTPSQPMPTPPPTPSTAPVFASDEEALAAAEEAYGRFLSTLDQIFVDGGANPERLLDVASQEILDHEMAGFEQLKASGERGTGATTTTLTLQYADLASGEVTVYACDDISDTDILDSSGRSVVREGRTTKYEYEVTLADNPMIVTSRVPWDGSSICS